MQNESIPVNYYTSCGGDYLYVNGVYEKQCSASERLNVIMQIYECMAYSIVYESRRPSEIQGQLGFYVDQAFYRLPAPLAGIALFYFAVLNLIIMTHVQKQMGGGGSATLMLHQAQIGFDLMMIIVILPLEQIPSMVKHVITGTVINSILICVFGIYLNIWYKYFIKYTVIELFRKIICAREPTIFNYGYQFYYLIGIQLL
jgi:hypothetical protein